jgi:hypothetical protein
MALQRFTRRAAEAARLGDLDISSSTYGGVIPLGFGVQKVAGTIIWATDIEEEMRRRTEGEGRVPSCSSFPRIQRG